MAESSATVQPENDLHVLFKKEAEIVKRSTVSQEERGSELGSIDTAAWFAQYFVVSSSAFFTCALYASVTLFLSLAFA